MRLLNLTMPVLSCEHRPAILAPNTPVPVTDSAHRILPPKQTLLRRGLFWGNPKPWGTPGNYSGDAV